MKTETLHVTETEERILNAALKVVNDVTISGTRMHLIANKADMVQTNVHYDYKTKQEQFNRTGSMKTACSQSSCSAFTR